MTYKKVVLSLLLAGMMTGCASLDAVVAPTQPYKDMLDNRDSSLTALNAASSCCASLQALHYAPLPADKATVVGIDGRSQVFAFPEGKSYLAAYNLS